MKKDNNLFITISDSDNQELAKVIKKYNELELQQKLIDKKMKEFKDFLKQYDFDQIILQDNNETYIMEIKKYQQTRKSINEEKLLKIITQEQLEEVKDTKVNDCIKFSVKVATKGS